MKVDFIDNPDIREDFSFVTHPISFNSCNFLPDQENRSESDTMKLVFREKERLEGTLRPDNHRCSRSLRSRYVTVAFSASVFADQTSFARAARGGGAGTSLESESTSVHPERRIQLSCREILPAEVIRESLPRLRS